MPEVTEVSLRRHRTVYRSMVRLYPRELRTSHGIEMVQAFSDLVRERGRRMWARTAVDLAVSLPRTHLEGIMSTPATRATIGIALAAAAALAVLAVLVFGPVALPVPIALLAIAVAQRSRLARAVDGVTRRRRSGVLIGLVVSVLVLAGSVGSWVLAIGRGYSFPDGVLVVYNLLGVGSVLGIVVCSALVVGRRHHRTADGDAAIGS